MYLFTRTRYFRQLESNKVPFNEAVNLRFTACFHLFDGIRDQINDIRAQSFVGVMMTQKRRDSHHICLKN